MDMSVNQRQGQGTLIGHTRDRKTTVNMAVTQSTLFSRSSALYFILKMTGATEPSHRGGQG